ncbi:MAG: choice-of-anchor D domain-containing protein [Spirochaetota bacterium]
MKRKPAISILFLVTLIIFALCSKENVWEKVNRTDSPAYFVTVLSTTPSSNETYVPTNSLITVTFSDNILASTLNAATISVNNGVTPLSISYDSNTKTVTYSPQASLSQNTTYTVILSREITNSAGEGLSVDYSWSFTTVSGLVPEIDLFQGIFPLNTGSLYDFGTILDTETRAIVFTINNSGAGNLTVNSISLGGIDAGEFTLTTGVLPATVIAGGQTTFTATFDPNSAGVKNASIIISNDDGNESSYTVYIKGYAAGTAQPEIMLRQGLTEFVAGYNYDFGTVLVGSSSSAVTFTIYNIGNDVLNISSIALDSGDPDIGNFILDTSGTSFIVAAQSNTTFTGRFAPIEAGVVLVQLRIESNDIDESSFMFKFKGRGANP